jgi:hypothetical protein
LPRFFLHVIMVVEQHCRCHHQALNSSYRQYRYIFLFMQKQVKSGLQPTWSVLKQCRVHVPLPSSIHRWLRQPLTRCKYRDAKFFTSLLYTYCWQRAITPCCMHLPRLLGSTAWRPRRCRCSRGTCLSVRPFIFIQLLRRPKGQPGLLLASAACHACSLFVRATRRRGMRVASAAAAVPAWPHSNPGAVQNQSVRPSLRPAIDGLRSLCSAVRLPLSPRRRPARRRRTTPAFFLGKRKTCFFLLLIELP